MYVISSAGSGEGNSGLTFFGRGCRFDWVVMVVVMP